MTNYQQQLQDIESQIQALTKAKSEVEYKIKLQNASEKEKAIHKFTEDIRALEPAYRKKGYELRVSEPDTLFYMVDVTIKDIESGCVFSYATMEVNEQVLRLPTVLGGILEASINPLDVVVAIAQRVYGVFEFQEDTVKKPFTIDYNVGETDEKIFLDLGFVFHDTVHDIDINLTFPLDTYNPLVLTMNTNLSESSERTTVELPNFPYDLDISVSNGYQNSQEYATVDMSHFEWFTDENRFDIEDAVDVIRAFAHTVKDVNIDSLAPSNTTKKR